MTTPPKTSAELHLMAGSPPPPEKLITLHNWFMGEPVRWSFKNIPKLLPCAEAHRGKGAPSALPEGTRQDIPGLTFKDPDGKTMTIKELIDLTYTDGLLVMHKGQLVYEDYFNMHEYQRHLLMSVSKSLTACLLAVMVERGEIDVSRSIASYLPAYQNSAYGDATVQQVLDMTVSIKYDETYDDLLSDVSLHSIAGGWYGHYDRSGDYAELPWSIYEYLPTLTEKQSYEHGSTWHYVSANTDVLGILLETVGKKSFMALFQEHIWQHLGAEENAAMTVDPWGAAFPNGGFCVTLRDLARFGMMALRDGAWNGRQIVPRAFFDDVRNNGDKSAWLRGDSVAFLPNGAYRNQFWVIGNDNGAYFGVGIHGQYCYIDPTADVVITKLSSHPEALVEFNSAATIAAFAAIADSLSGLA